MNNTDIFGNISNQANIDFTQNKLMSIKNGEIYFNSSFFNEKQSKYFFNKLLKEIKWQQESMFMYGKKINFPRLTAWYGDNDMPYSFSGITLNPNNWTDELIEIRNLIEPIAKTKFNSVLLNLYRNGKDSISWHTDAEKELGRNPIIASVSLGATRKFQLRHNETKEKIEIPLNNGSLLIMMGELQHYWQHQVPKSNDNLSERINLTFRTIK